MCRRFHDWFWGSFVDGGAIGAIAAPLLGLVMAWALLSALGIGR